MHTVARRSFPAYLCEPACIGSSISASVLRAALLKKTFRSGRTVVGVLGFLILFAILVILVSKFYLIPVLEIAQHSTHAHRRKMAAQAMLLMVVMLTILLVGLLITFRISRFFFPPPTDARSRTKVVDAWTEAGKRIEESKDPVDDEES